MALLDQVTTIAYYIVGVLAFIMIVGFVTFIILKKNRKQNLKDAYDSSDYANLTRFDSKDYIKIDDIIDNVVITDNWTRFIGVIDCAGFDFYSMSEEEQFITMQNYMPFINTIDAPITFRQYCQSSDMEDTILRYNDALKKVSLQFENIFLQIDEMESLYQSSSKEERNYYQQYLDELIRQMDALEFRKLHIMDQIKYIEDFSGNNVAPLLTETYVFEWTTAKLEMADAMSKEQIFMKAKVELNSIAKSKIHSLNASGVKARRCSTEALIDMFRRHSLPVSSERFKKSDLRKIDFDADIITSDSLETYRKKVAAFKKEVLSAQFDMMFDDVATETFDELIRTSDISTRPGDNTTSVTEQSNHTETNSDDGSTTTEPTSIYNF